MNDSYLQKSLEFDEKLLAVSIIESNESLVSLQELFILENVPILFNSNTDIHAKTKKQFFLRKTVAETLLAAAKEFSKNNLLIFVEDAYRSLDIQKTKFLKEVKNLQEQFSDMSINEVKARVNVYVAGIPILAAHTAGAAIDVTLVYKDSLLPVDFGSSYNNFNEISMTEYPHISKEAKNNRLFFKSIMEKHRLINYPFEFWHFSMGDVCAAYIKKQPSAIFGPVSFDRFSGKFTALQPSKYHSFFNLKDKKEILLCSRKTT